MTPAHSKRRVLVIEDNADFAQILSDILTIKGCEVQIMPDAKAGLDFTRRSSPDLIFCDIGLRGDMNGLGFAEAVRSDKSIAHIPLIAVSGFTSDEDRRKATEAGFQLVFPKPVKFADITKALETFESSTESAGKIDEKTSGILQRHNIGFGEIIVLEKHIAEVIFAEGVHLSASHVDIYHASLTKLLEAPFFLLINKLHRYTYDVLARSKLGTFEKVKAFAIVAYDEVSRIQSENTGYVLPKGMRWNMRIFSDRQSALDWLKTEQLYFCG